VVTISRHHAGFKVPSRKIVVRSSNQPGTLKPEDRGSVKQSARHFEALKPEDRGSVKQSARHFEARHFEAGTLKPAGLPAGDEDPWGAAIAGCD
jgi:hypothetical protein